MSSLCQVHVVSKADIAEHTTVIVKSQPQRPLAGSHIRVRSRLIGLTSNNLSYALLGSIRHWWDAYPVTQELPAPYNDIERYGIGPAWGYGEVLKSKVPSIDAGTLLWGFWPTSSLPVDLQLVSAGASGHWIETSEHRQNLMNLYQRYFVREYQLSSDLLDKSKTERMAWEVGCQPTWEAGHLLNYAVFGDEHIHPANAGKWDATDADLRSAVVVSLSASGKTARGLTDGLVNRRSPESGPLGLLAITAHSKSDLVPQAAFPTKTVSYQTMTDDSTFDWIKAQSPRKVVVVDFGGRGDSVVQLLEALDKHFAETVEIVTIGVGGSPSVHKPDQLGQWAQRNNAIESRIQMNASDIRDALLERVGAETYWGTLTEAWNGFIGGDSAKDLKIEIHKGVEGEEGIEGGWNRLCESKVPADVVLAYEI